MDIAIEEYDVELIMADQYKNLYILRENSYCSTCRGASTIVDYKPFLNNLNDIILKGFCAECGGKVNRYIETGERRQNAEVAKHIRNVLALFKKRKK